MIPSRRGADTLHHVEGDLVVADKLALQSIIKQCGPLWEAARGKHLVVVGPLPRYVTVSCCGNSKHMADRESEGFNTKLMTDLAACCAAIKDCLFNTGTRNGRVMDPLRNLKGLAAAEIWGVDPVQVPHLLSAGRQCGGS